MNPIETLGLALGAGFSSGLNLYEPWPRLGSSSALAFFTFRLPSRRSLIPGSWESRSRFIWWSFAQTKFLTSTRYGMRFTPSFARRPRRFLLMPLRAEPRLNGVGELR